MVGLGLMRKFVTVTVGADDDDDEGWTDPVVGGAVVGVADGTFVTIITVGTLSTTFAYWLPPLVCNNAMMAVVVDGWLSVASNAAGDNCNEFEVMV